MSKVREDKIMDLLEDKIYLVQENISELERYIKEKNIKYLDKDLEELKDILKDLEKELED